MSEADIDKAVKDAEKYAEEDKKRREAVDAKNNGENLVFQCEKAMTDFGDKVTDADKAPITEKCNALKEALKTDNTEEIKAKTEELQKAFYDLSGKVYQQAGAAQGQPDMGNMGNMGNMGGMNGGSSNPGGDDGDVVDADFTEA